LDLCISYYFVCTTLSVTLLVLLLISLFFFFFFFQAEDGIRDRTVTGVQTCALPISSARGFHPRHCRCPPGAQPGSHLQRERKREIGRASCREECRSRWATYD